MKITEYDYTLPQELIAQFPVERRDESRLMIVRRGEQSIEHKRFHDIASFLHQGDCLVVNETKVFPSRLRARRVPTGAQIEVFLLRAHDETLWETLVKPGRRATVGTRLRFEDGMSGEVIDLLEDGRRLIRFDGDEPVTDFMDRWGEVPLPPYVSRRPTEADRDRYQTVYAKEPGAVAAPTAGLHFTDELLDTLKMKSVRIAPVLLHVGIGTFRPVSTEDPREHQMESEYYEISTGSADMINEIKCEGGRIVAVGTTTVRTLESAVDEEKRLKKQSGWTDMFIYEPYTFKVVDVLLTNFHLPRSTLLMLVSAFAGREFIMEAYQEAIKEKYRFYSYGDAMLIL